MPGKLRAVNVSLAARLEKCAVRYPLHLPQSDQEDRGKVRLLVRLSYGENK